MSASQIARWARLAVFAGDTGIRCQLIDTCIIAYTRMRAVFSVAAERGRGLKRTTFELEKPAGSASMLARNSK